MRLRPLRHAPKKQKKQLKQKEAEAAKQTQLKQKQSAFNADMSALYESNPNATYSDWKVVGKNTVSPVRLT